MPLLITGRGLPLAPRIGTHVLSIQQESAPLVPQAWSGKRLEVGKDDPANGFRGLPSSTRIII
jgi:hypothetical protein